MSLFSAVLAPVASIATQQLNAATTYVVQNAAIKVTESTKKIADTLGYGSQFEKLGSALPSVEDLVNRGFRAGTSELTNNPFVAQQMEIMRQRAEPTVSASDLSVATGGAGDSTSHVVRLTDSDGAVVFFEVMPEIVESRSVAYDAVAPVQGPGAFQKYRGTESTQWTLNVTFIARNSDDATRNLNFLNMLRGWSMPYFGDNTGQAFPTKLGAPPPVLTLSGLRERIIGPVPVVITALNWNWPRDVDYIPTNIAVGDTIGANGQAQGSGGRELIPFPTVMTLAIQLVESYSTAQMNAFNLRDFREGLMVTAFNSSTQG